MRHLRYSRSTAFCSRISYSVKTTMVTLLGLPHITISVVPLSEHLPNVMNIPFISGFISSAINTAAAEYVAPKSLTLDLQKLISGDDIKKGTLSVALAVLHTDSHIRARHGSTWRSHRPHPSCDRLAEG